MKETVVVKCTKCLFAIYNSLGSICLEVPGWGARGSHHHNEAPRNRSCGNKQVQELSMFSWLSKHKWNIYIYIFFYSFCNGFLQYQLHYVKIESKNIQDVSFHAFSIEKKVESIPRCLVTVTHLTPHPGASKHFKPVLLFQYPCG